MRSGWLILPLGTVALTAMLAVPAPPASAKGRSCSARSVKRLKMLNRDALDELDRWNLAKAKRKLNDANLIARSRGCLKHPVHAMTYVILGVVAERNRKTAAMKKAWTQAMHIHWQVALPKRALSAKLLRLWRWVRSNTQPAERPAPRPDPRADPRHRPRTGPRPRPRRPAAPPKAFEHENPRKWYKGQRLTLVVRAPDRMGMVSAKLYYRPKGKKRFKVKAFLRGGPDKWSWQVSIPGVYLYIPELQYFIVAYGAKNQPISASGNSFQPKKIKFVQK